MDGLIDVFYLCRDGEVISDYLLDRVPVITKDARVVGKDTSGDLGNVIHDAGASLFRLCNVLGNHLLTIVAQLGDLRHV